MSDPQRKQNELEVTAGRPFWGAVRDAVSRLRFEGYSLEMWESSGWLWREFVIKGDEKALLVIRDMVNDYNAARDATRTAYRP